MASNEDRRDATVDRRALVADFEEAIGRLESALRRCPDELWQASMWRVKRTDPWIWPKRGTVPIPERTDESIQIYSWVGTVAYHCLWFLDFYQTTEPAGFETPDYVRGGPEEMAWPPDGAAPLPDRVFDRDVLLRYLAHGRDKILERLVTVTDADLGALCPVGHPQAGKSLLELLMVNLEHVREHGRQIESFLTARGVAGG
jgi:hypothetical protein